MDALGFIYSIPSQECDTRNLIMFVLSVWECITYETFNFSCNFFLGLLSDGSFWSWEKHISWHDVSPNSKFKHYSVLDIFKHVWNVWRQSSILRNSNVNRYNSLLTITFFFVFSNWNFRKWEKHYLKVAIRNKNKTVMLSSVKSRISEEQKCS